MTLSFNNGNNLSSNVKSEENKKYTRYITTANVMSSYRDTGTNIEVVEPNSIQDTSTKAANKILISKINFLQSKRMNDKIKSRIIRIGMNGFTVTKRLLIMAMSSSIEITNEKHYKYYRCKRKYCYYLHCRSDVDVLCVKIKNKIQEWK